MNELLKPKMANHYNVKFQTVYNILAGQADVLRNYLIGISELHHSGSHVCTFSFMDDTTNEIEQALRTLYRGETPEITVEYLDEVENVLRSFKLVKPEIKGIRYSELNVYKLEPLRLYLDVQYNGLMPV